MFFNRFKMAAISAAVLVSLGSQVSAEELRIRVTAESLTAENATFLTPIWVGFHDGSFDTYNGNTRANSRPVEGSVAMERLCEDGNNDPIAQDFAALVPGGQDTSLFGPNGQVGPGQFASTEFVLDSDDVANRYFSYASMIIPSNDFCISNGNPLAHKIFDDAGNFVGQNFFVTGSEILDAGTEVNDEIPANTAFFGQAAPDTGVDENGFIGTLGSDLVDVSGFQPVGSGGILDSERFSAGDFSVRGFPVVKFSFEIVDGTQNNSFDSVLDGDQEVPAVATRASGDAEFVVSEDGQSVDYVINLRRSPVTDVGLFQVTMAHLHRAPAGENGPVVVNLLSGIDISNIFNLRELTGTLTASDLVGPLAGRRFTSLVDELRNGNIYINIHTTTNPAGLIRGQVLPIEE